MRKLGTIDLEVLFLAIKENGTFNENHLENSNLKRLGVGKILDALASLKDRKMISLNKDGSFSITKVAREILWSKNIPSWAKVLRLLQTKSCTIMEISEILMLPENEIFTEIELLRKNQLILMSPQRQEEKIVKVYEILPEGIEEIDKTETEGFDNVSFVKPKPEIEIMEMIEEISDDVQALEIEQAQKDSISKKLFAIRDKLEI